MTKFKIKEMTIKLDIEKVENKTAAKQAITAAFTNTIQTLNIFAGKQIATLEKGKDIFVIEYKPKKKVRLTEKNIIRFITYHLTQLLRNNDKALLKTLLEKIEVS